MSSLPPSLLISVLHCIIIISAQQTTFTISIVTLLLQRWPLGAVFFCFVSFFNFIFPKHNSCCIQRQRLISNCSRVWLVIWVLLTLKNFLNLPGWCCKLKSHKQKSAWPSNASSQAGCIFLERVAGHSRTSWLENGLRLIWLGKPCRCCLNIGKCSRTRGDALCSSSTIDGCINIF